MGDVLKNLRLKSQKRKKLLAQTVSGSKFHTYILLNKEIDSFPFLVFFFFFLPIYFDQNPARNF